MLVNGSDVTFGAVRTSWKRMLDAIPKGKFTRIMEDTQLIELVLMTAFTMDKELTDRRNADHEPRA